MIKTPKTTLLTASTLALIVAACGGTEADTPAPGTVAATQNTTGEPESGESWQGTTDAEAATVALADGQPKPNEYWWPEGVDLGPLRQHETNANPMGADFDYAAQFNELDLDAVKADLTALMTDSQDWWPADYGHYGPFFIRMAWHSAGTYRLMDGRGGAAGGQLRFAPLNSWPDNTNLDKARQLLWPVKQKYGDAISWADLMVLTGNVAMESMGFKTYGFAGGREDDWQPELVYWGPETDFLGADKRYAGGELERPLGASVMGLIYVNPEGPNGSGDPIAAAEKIRETFGRMAMNDEETVALIAGGHTFGKSHGAYDPKECLSPEPAAMGIDAMGGGWKNACGKGMAEDTVTSGLEGAWTANPAEWTHQYLTFLFNFDWERTESPAGAIQWRPIGDEASELVPDAHRADVRHAPMMLTTDLALIEDPAYRAVSQRFLDDPTAFETAFAKAWFKLTHRDLGPRSGYLGDMQPDEDFVWQDPIPAVDHALITDADAEALKAEIMATGLTPDALVRTAWAAAASYRGTDQRGGTNGGRLRLAPQNAWAANGPDEVAEVLTRLEGVQRDFNEGASGGKRVSLADLIVLGGACGVEEAAQKAGHDVQVPFTPGRMDASTEQTDAASFAYLEPQADGFRNYYAEGARLSPAQALVDRADVLTLNVREMTALLGGMRALGATHGGSAHGVLTDRPGALTNDFFVNLVDMSNVWQPANEDGVYVATRRGEDAPRWTATEVDLVFGSNAELRAVAERYAYAGGEDVFVEDFVDAWSKVMNLGRTDV